MVKHWLLHIVLFGVTLISNAQGFTSHIEVSTDSIQLGEPIEVAVSMHYPVGKQLLFPDSLDDFGSFTFLNKVAHPTKTTDSISVDSATYTLTSFELTSPQYLKVPIYLITINDTIIAKTDSIAIYLQQIINGLPEKIELKKNTKAIDLKKEVNYPLWGLIGLAVLIVIIILFIVFGGKVVRSIQISRIEKSHRQFKERFIQEVQQVESNPELAEQLIRAWKNHLTKVSKTPYNSYSTSEIYALTKNEQLKKDLRLFDQLIYSTTKQGTVLQAKDSLLAFAEETVENRVKQIKHHGRKG